MITLAALALIPTVLFAAGHASRWLIALAGEKGARS